MPRLRTLLAGRSERVIVGITGAPGAGKTTLADCVRDALVAVDASAASWAITLPMDGFHLADVSLERLGLRDRKGASETFDAAGYVNLLHRIRTDRTSIIYAPTFERTLEQPIAAGQAIDPAVRLVITEGNYLLNDGPWAAVRPLLDEVWFCEVDGALRHERLIARHVAFGKSPDEAERWVAAVDEKNAMIIEGNRAKADLIVRVG